MPDARICIFRSYIACVLTALEHEQQLASLNIYCW